MKYIYILIPLILLFSCDGDNDGSKISEDFTNFIDAKSLRIYAKDDVSSGFLNNVGKSYEAMFTDNSNIDESMRAYYLSTSKDEYVWQRVGLEASFNKNESYAEGFPPRPYRHNVTDYIWEMDTGGKDQIGEVIEHLLHTVTTVILYLAYPNEWDYNKSSSALSLAMQEAIDKGIYDISSYEDIKNDEEGYNKVLTQEYAYWLILAEWDYYVVADKKRDGISGNEEFIIGTPDEIEFQLPLGHKLYKDYVEKILSIPNSETIIALFL